MAYAAQKITPYLWFDGKAEEAIRFYVSLFPDSEVVNLMKSEDPNHGGVLTATFRLAGQEFMALDGGPMFKFTEAISLFVKCDSQEEVDRLWEALSDGGEVQQCGWLKDRFGLSWQIIPNRLGELMGSGDPEVAQRVVNAMLQMKKMDIAGLEAAAAGN